MATIDFEKEKTDIMNVLEREREVCISNLKANIKEQEITIDEHEKIIKICKTKINEIENRILLEQQEDVDGKAEKIAKDITLIANHKKCKDVFVYDRKICIDTTPLIISEPITGKYFYLGEMRIAIPLCSDIILDIKMINMENSRMAWNSSLMNHPHVFASQDGCFGSLNPSMVQYLKNKEIYAVYILLLGFLQTCNIGDEAGRYVASWDECDEDGEIIEYAEEETVLLKDGRKVNKEIYFCESCGVEVLESEVYYCDKCGVPLCGDCVEFKGQYDTPLCHDCASRAHECDDCGCLLLEDEDNIFYDEDGNLICEYCIDKYEYDEEEGIYYRK